MTKAEALLVPRADAHVARFDDGGVVFVEQDVTLVRLNSTGMVVWDCIDGASTLAVIVADIAEGYGVAPDVIEADVAPLVASFIESGLVSLG